MSWRSRVFSAGLMAVVLAGLVFGFMGHILFPSDDVLSGSDFREIHYPLLKFVVDAARDTGELPLWNPHQYLGYSVIGNSQYGLFYPPNWLLLLTHGATIYRAVGWLIALHLFWHVLGMATLARLYGADLWPAIIAGAIGGFGGTFAARIYAGHYAMILTLAWLPWIMAGYRLAAQKSHPVWALPGGIALALGTLAGHPQTMTIAVIGVGMQWCYDLLVAPNHAERWRKTRQIILLALAGTLLSAVTWLPALDYSSKTTRGTELDSLDFANEHALAPNDLLSWVIPHLFGTPDSEQLPYWLDTPLFEEMFGYAGLLALLLAFYPLKMRRRWLFIAMVLTGVLLSIGTDSSLFMVQYRWLPPIRNFRAPGRALILTSTGLAMLAALALTDLGNRTQTERTHVLATTNARIIPVGIILLWGTGAVLTVIAALTDGATADRAYALAGAVTLSGLFMLLAGAALRAWDTGNARLGRHFALGVTLVIVVLDLWHASMPLVKTGPVELSQVWRDAQEVIPLPADSDYARVMQTVPPGGIPNGASWAGYHSFQGYDPLTPATWFDLVRIADWSPDTSVSRMAGVRYVLSGFALDGIEGLARLDSTSPYLFYENTQALPRAYLVERYEAVPDGALLLQRIALGHLDGGDVALLSYDPSCPIAGNDGTVTITHYEPNSVAIEVEQDGPGLLVLSDQYDDDWTVSIDGSETTLLRANYVMRAVCVPAGAHTVSFEYRPWVYRVGGLVSAVGWALLLVGSIGGVLWWTRKQHTPNKAI